MQLNKENKSAVAVAIQGLYQSTLKFNTLAGNDYKDKTLFNNQLENVKSELRETIEALEAGDLGELVKESLDLAVVLSFLVMIIDGNDSVCVNPPLYLNSEDLTVEELVPLITGYVDTEDYINALCSTEDLIYQLNADAIHNAKEVGDSNLSKFILAKDLDASENSEFDIIDSFVEDGRYEDVYSEVLTYEGEEWVVFKAKRDARNNEVYPKGKILKNMLTFKNPSLVIYE